MTTQDGRAVGMRWGARTPWNFHHPTKTSFLRSLHEEEHGQVFEEYDADPIRHSMRSGPSKVPVDDDHRDQDAHRIHDERKEKVFGNQRKDEGSRGEDLGDKEEEHDEGEENGDTQCHLLPGLGRQIKDEHAKKGDEHCGQDQVHRVEQRLSPDGDVERNVRIFRGPFVHVQIRRHLDDVPRSRLPIIRQVHVFLVVVQM